jgi:hypothetical protein
MKTLTKTQADFLDYLEPASGEPKETPVRTFMVDNFDKPKDLNEFADNDKEPGKLFLLDLLDYELIEGDRNYVTHICTYTWVAHRGDKKYQQWFDTLEPVAKMKITPQGLEALNDYRNSHLVSETLKSVKKTNRFQRVSSVVTLIAIAITAFISIISYLKDDAPNLILIRKSMQRQEQILDSMKQVQIGIDSSLRIMAKKTLPKKN